MSSQINLNDPDILMSILSAIEARFNMEMAQAKSNYASFCITTGLVNQLATLMPVSLLAIGPGDLAIKGEWKPGLNLWLGIGPILPETGFYKTVFNFHVCSVNDENVEFYPSFIMNINRPSMIAEIRQVITNVTNGVKVDWQFMDDPNMQGMVERVSKPKGTGEEIPTNDDFLKFMEKLVNTRGDKGGKVN